MSRLDGSTNSQSDSELFIPDAMRFAIGGVIWRMAQTDQGMERVRWAKVTVQLGESGRFANTDDQGRYRFYNLPRGVYPLVIRTLVQPPALGDKLADGPTITVPPPAHYDVVIPITPPNNQSPNPAPVPPPGTQPTQASASESAAAPISVASEPEPIVPEPPPQVQMSEVKVSEPDITELQPTEAELPKTSISAEEVPDKPKGKGSKKR